MILAPAQLPLAAYLRGMEDPAMRWLTKTALVRYREHGAKRFRMGYLDATRLPFPVPGGVDQGNALDCYLTEGPDVFAARYPVRPTPPADMPPRPQERHRTAKKPSPETVSAFKAWDEWDAAHPMQAGALEISDEDRAILADCVEAVQALPMWPELVAARAQHTVRRLVTPGIGVQSRPDWLMANATCDLKKTRDLDMFPRQAIDLGYTIQAAVAGYCLAGDGVAAEHSYLLAVEWAYGARARVYEIPSEVLVYATREMDRLIGEIVWRFENDNWTETQPGPEMLPVPGWKMKEIENA